MTWNRGPDSVGIRAELHVGSLAKLVDVESRNALVICRGIYCGREHKAPLLLYLMPSDLSHSLLILRGLRTRLSSLYQVHVLLIRSSL